MSRKVRKLTGHIRPADISTFMPSGPFYLNSLDRPISYIRGVCLVLVLPCLTEIPAGLGGSVRCADRLETRRLRVQPRRGRQHSFVEIDHEIFSTVILSLPLILEGQLSVSGERMCTILVNRLED